MADIVIALQNRKNTELLAKFLEQHHVIMPFDKQLPQNFDLLIVDYWFSQYFQPQIKHYKELVKPIFLPILLVSSKQDISPTNYRIANYIDEVLFTPVEKPELRMRLDMLLQAREYSLESQKNYFQLVNNSPVGIYISQNDTIQYANDELLKILGISREDMIGANFHDFLQLENDSDLSCIEGSKRELNLMISERHFTIELHTQRVTHLGKPAILGIIIDITSRKKRETQISELSNNLQETITKLQNAQEILMEQERIRVIGEMASGIAHDFNNALSPISGYSQLLLKYPEMRENQVTLVRYLQNIHTAAQDAGRMIARLREHYRKREDLEEMVSVDLNTIIDQAIELTQPKWQNHRKKIRVFTQYGDIPEILGISSELREMLSNLIFNAVDAMPQGGNLCFETLHQDDSVILKVKDTGMGMSPQIQEHCWEAFFSTKKQQGTGLGLVMVYNIIQNHQGKVSISSEKNQGTIFTIVFPIPLESSVIEKPKTNETIEKALRILVVDDELSNLDVISIVLQNDGHFVETAQNGEEGWEKFTETCFDVVITDQAMPKMQGDEIIDKIKHLSSVKTVLMTGFVDVSNNAADYFMSKPVDINVLRSIIAQISHELHQQSQSGNYVSDFQITIDLPAEQLNHLKDFAMSGYVSEIERILDFLEQQHEYQPFVKTARKLNDNFQFDELLQLLQNSWSSNQVV